MASSLLKTHKIRADSPRMAPFEDAADQIVTALTPTRQSHCARGCWSLGAGCRQTALPFEDRTWKAAVVGRVAVCGPLILIDRESAEYHD